MCESCMLKCQPNDIIFGLDDEEQAAEQLAKVRRRRLPIRNLFGLLLMTACGAPTDSGYTGEVPLSFQVAPGVATVTLSVSAADIPNAIRFNIPLTAGLATDTIRIPPGLARTFTVRGYDTDGTQTHEGSQTVDIVAGPNPSITIFVFGIGATAEVKIIATFTVDIDPATIIISILASPPEVTPALLVNGDTVSNTLATWTVQNPAIASIDAAGTVTALLIGSTHIFALIGDEQDSSAVSIF